ncbi:MAG: class I SAM-dependent methyltransferase [Clostridiales bacterium]|nr:class I SAM-dependent methyltransferase [Clostridiales bacterium]
MDNEQIQAEALSFLDTRGILRAADLGCGAGGQTIAPAQNIRGSIVGLDQIPGFIDELNAKALNLGLQGSASGVVGSMENLPFFEKETFGRIWPEGAIDAIGFEKGPAHWSGFLKMNGYAAVACPCRLAGEHPDEVERFWSNADSGLER